MNTKSGEKKSVLVYLTLTIIVALAICGVVYAKSAGFRSNVNANLPWLKEMLAERGISFDQKAKEPQPVVEEVVESTPAVAETSVPTPEPEVAAAEPAPAPVSTTVDLTELATNRDEWPKKLTLKKVVSFPAVLNGKVIGKVNAPAGSEVNLVMMKNGKVGVEFKGGGAMLEPADTDLVQKVLKARNQKSAYPTFVDAPSTTTTDSASLQ